MAHLRGFEPLYASVDQSSQKVADGLGCYDFIQKNSSSVLTHVMASISLLQIHGHQLASVRHLYPTRH